jgi:hypothetical protein
MCEKDNEDLNLAFLWKSDSLIERLREPTRKLAPNLMGKVSFKKCKQLFENQH